MNIDKCKECNSTSLEKCLKIQCPYFINIKRDENEDEDTKAEMESENEIGNIEKQTNENREKRYALDALEWGIDFMIKKLEEELDYIKYYCAL